MKCPNCAHQNSKVIDSRHAEDLESIRKYLGLDTNWILQQFRQPPDGVLDRKEYEAYPDAWLKEIGEKLNCKVRGLH